MHLEKPDDNSLDLAQIAVRGASWTYVAYYSSKFMVLLSTIVLARLLSQTEFGVFGYAVTIISFFDTVKDLGVSASLIYHKEDKVVNTGFWLNLGIGVLLFLLIWLFAPLAGSFFNDDRAINVTRAFALNFPLASLGATHEVLLVRELAFNRKFLPEFLKAISKGVISIVLAFLGFGTWSLIIGQLAGTVIGVIVLWKIVSWRPTFSFNISFARSLLNFGLSMATLSVVSFFAQDIDYLLIGRYLGAEAMGVYSLAFRIPELIILQFCATVAQVVFPLFSKIRDDEETLKIGFLETTRYVALITIPLGLGIALLADPFVLTIFGEKWSNMIPVMQAIAIYSIFFSLGFNAGDIYKAQGKPYLLTLIAIVRIIILTPFMYWAVTIPASIVVASWVQVLVSLVISSIYLIVAIRMLKVSLTALLLAFKTSIIPAILMIIALIGTNYLISSWADWLHLAIGILVGGIIYILSLYIFEREIVNQSINLVRGILKRQEKATEIS